VIFSVHFCFALVNWWLNVAEATIILYIYS